MLNFSPFQQGIIYNTPSYILLQSIFYLYANIYTIFVLILNYFLMQSAKLFQLIGISMPLTPLLISILQLHLAILLLTYIIINVIFLFLRLLFALFIHKAFRLYTVKRYYTEVV